MKTTKKMIVMAVMAISISQAANAQLLNTPTGTVGTNTTTDKVGIGTTTPAANLHINSPSVTSTGETILQTQVSDAPNDFLKISNGASANNTYLPVIWGHNQSGSGYNGMYVVGSSSPANDVIASPAVINMDARSLTGTTSSAVLNRALLQVGTMNTPSLRVFPNKVTFGTNSAALKADQGGSIELGGDNSVAGNGTPFIDFHYNGIVEDYNMRLINTGNKELSLHGGAFAVNMPASGTPISGVSINATSFNTTQNAINSYFLRLRDVGAGNKDVFQIKGTGQVLINTTCVPAANVMLAVNGQINATAVQVKLTDGSGCFPDYVFNKEYKLLSLGEVERYINANKHLPDVPSAEEVEAEGMDLAKMNNILLRKVEELTLHMIEMEKKIKVLEAK